MSSNAVLLHSSLLLFGSDYFAFAIHFQSRSKKNPKTFKIKLRIPVDIKTKRFEECGHLCIAATSVSNIL